MSPPTGGSKSQGRWRSAPEVEDLGGIIGTREQVLAAIQLQQRWRRRQAGGGGGKVAPTPAKGVGGARWRSAPEVHDLDEVIGTREQVLACIRIQRWRRRPATPAAERRNPMTQAQLRSWVRAKVTELEGFEDQVVIDSVCRRLEEVNLDRAAFESHLHILMEGRAVPFSAQLWRFLDGPTGATPEQRRDTASDDHEVQGLAAEARQATTEGAANEEDQPHEDQPQELARRPSQHDRRHSLPARQREGEREGERERRDSSEREGGGSSEREGGGSSECEETSSGLSTPSTADAAQSTPTTPPMPAHPDLSPGHTASGPTESYTATTIPCSYPTGSRPTGSYHSDRCAGSGKLRLLCACAACTAPQAAVRRERNNERCAAA